MKGLEVSVLDLSEVFIDNEKFRIDSEFFLKKYVSAYRNIKKIKHTQIKNIFETLSDFSANGSYANIAQNFTLLNEEDYAYMIRTTDLEKSDFVNNVKYVSKHSYEFLEKSKLFGGELLINKIGSPGRVYLIPKLNRPVSLGMNLFFLKLSNKTNLTEKFLWAYFNTEFGQKIIKRKVNGTVPLTIDKVAVKSLYVPVFSDDYIKNIDLLSTSSEAILKKSKLCFSQAQNQLLQKIGLQDFETKQTNNFQEISLSKSFISTTRLDAEYYHPKPLFLINQLKKKEYFLIKELFDIGNGYSWKSKYFKEQGEGEPFVRIRNCKPGYIDNETLTTLDSDYAKAEEIEKAKENDIVIGMDGIKYFYGSLVKEPVYINQRVCHLTPKENYEIDSELVLMIINSVIGQTQLM